MVYPRPRAEEDHHNVPLAWLNWVVFGRQSSKPNLAQLMVEPPHSDQSERDIHDQQPDADCDAAHDPFAECVGIIG